MKHLYVVAFLGMLTACVTNSPAYMPDGSQGQLVTCGGALFAYTDCLKRAGELCGENGYKIITADANASRYSTASGGWSANSMGGSGGFSGSSGTITNRSVMIRCNNTPAPHKSHKKKKEEDVQ